MHSSSQWCLSTRFNLRGTASLSLYICCQAHVRRFRALNISSPSGVWQEVAVPSRLYGMKSKQKPLAGTRVSIKDICHLSGVQTTLASRDWVLTHPVKMRSAEFVDKLVALRAVIIGKTATSAFAGPDWPTDGWIDFHCEWNMAWDDYWHHMADSFSIKVHLILEVMDI